MTVSSPPPVDRYLFPRLGYLASFALPLILALSNPGFGQQSSSVQRRLANSLRLSEGEIQTPILFTHSDQAAIELSITTPGGEILDIFLNYHSNRADGFQVLIDEGDGDLKPRPAPPLTTLKGTAIGSEIYRVRASYRRGQLRALIIGEQNSYGLQPLLDADPSASPGEYIVYRFKDILEGPESCGFRLPTGPDESELGGGGGGFGAPLGGAGSPIRVVQIACDADETFYNENNSDIDDTVGDIEAIMNNVEGAYESAPLELVYEITTVVVRTSPTYNNFGPSSLLNEFDNRWSSPPESSIFRDVAHLFTDRNLSGTTIGIARFAVVCNLSSAYALSQSTYTGNFALRSSLTAHELGHNFAASHCNGSSGCRIMCSGNGGCNGINPLIFGPSATGQIDSFSDSRACLSPIPDPLALPFVDEFESGVISALNWTFVKGAIASSEASGEPSAPWSVRLNATGTSSFQADELRSAELLLAGTTDPQVRFFTQHDGVPAGASLRVEYRNVFGTWQLLTEVISDGIDESTFEEHVFILPTSAKHDGFRLRFIPVVDSTSENWYVDNVSVTDGPLIPPPPEFVNLDRVTGPVAGGVTVSIFGNSFASDAQVFFGINPLGNLEFIDSSELRGTVPPGQTGPVTISIAQLSGSALVPDGFIYTDNSLRLTQTSSSPGSVAVVEAIAEHDLPIEGYSIAATFDPTWLSVASIGVTDTDASFAEFVAPNSGADFFTVGVALDLSPPLDQSLPAGSQSVARIELEVDASAPVDLDIPIELGNGIGDTVVDSIFALSSGVAASPEFEDGLVTIASGSLFLRADVNGDGTLNIADPVAALAFLFQGEPAACLDAIDSNDDGSTNVADAVYSLNFLFTGGPAPLEPWPNPGLDPTPDALDCQN